MAVIIRRNRLAITAVLAAALLAAGCSHFSGMHWPWQHKAAVPPAPVHEVAETFSNGTPAAFPQYWKRNTLLVDLQAAGAEGSVVLTPLPGTQWPVRIAVRVTPGSIGVLEVRGEARMVLPVAREGHQPIDLELPPGVYAPTTAQIVIRWGAQ